MPDLGPTYLPIFQAVKWSGDEIDHSPVTNTEVKNEWSYIATPQYPFNAYTLRGFFYFLVDFLSVIFSVTSTSHFVTANACFDLAEEINTSYPRF